MRYVRYSFKLYYIKDVVLIFCVIRMLNRYVKVRVVLFIYLKVFKLFLGLGFRLFGFFEKKMLRLNNRCFLNYYV